MTNKRSRRGIVYLFRGSLALFLCVSFTSVTTFAQNNRPGNPRGYSPDVLLEVFKLTQADSDVAFDTLMQACPARDCIPSIDQPVYVSPPDVDYLQDDDLLLTITHNGITRAYPTRILDHHEIVNDMFGSYPVAVTYCPLCGSGLAFDRRQDGQVLEFGEPEMLKTKNFGRKSLNEIKEILADMGLSFGMKVDERGRPVVEQAES